MTNHWFLWLLDPPIRYWANRKTPSDASTMSKRCFLSFIELHTCRHYSRIVHLIIHIIATYGHILREPIISHGKRHEVSARPIGDFKCTDLTRKTHAEPIIFDFIAIKPHANWHDRSNQTILLARLSGNWYVLKIAPRDASPRRRKMSQRHGKTARKVFLLPSLWSVPSK